MGFRCVVIWICKKSFKDFPKFLHGFVKIYKWISPSCHMDLSKSKLVFVFLALCQTLVAGTWTETKKMFLGGSFLKLADDDV